MSEPDRAIDGPDAHCAVALGDHLTRRTPQDVFFVGAIRVDRLAQQRGQHARTAVRGADATGDLLGGVAGPIERAVRLAHRRAQLAVHVGAVIVQWLRHEAADRRRGLRRAARRGRLLR